MKDLSQLPIDLQRKAERLLSALKNDLPKDIGVAAVNYAKGNIQRGRLRGASARQWPPRKKDGPKDQGRKLLVKTGAMMRRTRYRAKAQGVAVTSTPYAPVHNFGSKEKNIPERTFLAVTPLFLKITEGIIRHKVRTILRKR